MHFLPSSFHFQNGARGAAHRVGRSLMLAALAVAAVSPCAAANHSANGAWVATWGAGMVAVNPGNAPDLTGKTLREIVHSSVGGSQVRVWFSNAFGRTPLYLGAAHIAIRANGNESRGTSADASGIQSGSDRTLTFNGRGAVTIPPGAQVVSDAVTLDVPALRDLAVSMYFPNHTMAMTEHTDAQQISYAATGNAVGAASLAGRDWPQRSWYVVSGVDVDAPGDSAVVAIGASVTDGAHSTENANHRWPDDLAARLAADAGTKKAGVLGVVDVGIGGNRVLLNGYGPNGVARLNRDVLARSGVRYLIVLEGKNDIGRYATDHQPYGDLAQRLEAGIAQMAEQAHQHGIRVIGATLDPYEHCFYYSPGGEAVREALNQWIRTSPVLDGVIDFDKAVRDPQHPLELAPEYDSGDHLHPNDAGYQAMANAIDLSLFTTAAGAGRGTR